MIASRLFAVTRHIQRVSPASASALARFVTAPIQHTRFFADAIDFHDEDEEREWTESFKKATVGVAEMDPKTIDHDTSAQRMRDLVKSGLLRHTDLHDNPERFFEAHRIIAAHTSDVGPGFWVRFTVHQNLCCGTILGLGNEEQVQVLEVMQEKGELGCFSLTEKRAGVSSGLVVSTIAEYNHDNNTFLLNSPDVGAQKNWISQGLVADKTVVVADLRINGQSHGPHAFLMNLREDGELVPGVETFDMGLKTVGNDLDNAAIAFNNVILPKSALLSKFADVDNISGQYIQKVKGLPVFHMIGQRLFTGRVAVSQAAMEFRRGLFEKTKKFTDTKRCWSPHGDVTLSDIPHINALYERAEKEASTLDAFVSECERQLCVCLRNKKLPSLELVEAIACAKVKCVECSIQSCHQLQQDVGSYALMGGTGFENIDFLTCCKFAEGDSRILQQKMSRDRMKRYLANEACPTNVGTEDWEAENKACANLQASMIDIMKREKVDKHAAWDQCWVGVYDLSEIIMMRTMKSFMSSSSWESKGKVLGALEFTERDIG